jgi:hypothetical protein
LSEYQLASGGGADFQAGSSEDVMRQRLLKGGFLALALVAIVGGTLSAMPPGELFGCAVITLPDPDNPNKVTLCHFTGSDGNPFIINEVSESAATSHSDHHGDCVRPDGGPTVCVP